MNSNIDYNSFPVRFARCLNEQCKRGGQCLRRQVALLIPDTDYSVTVVNPAFYKSPTGEDCSLFMLDKPQRYARGFSLLFDNLPCKKAAVIKAQMKRYFGSATYYRCYHGERLLKPEEQKGIKQIFLQQNIDEDPKFDEYVEYYNLG